MSFSYRDYHNMNHNDLCPLMKQKIYHLNLNDYTVYEAVSDTIIDAVHEAIPLKTVKITCKSQREPWVTPELVKLIKERHALH